MKKFILSLFVFSACSFASVIGLDALGEEQIAGGMASTAGRGYAGGAKTGDAEGLSVMNPPLIPRSFSMSTFCWKWLTCKTMEMILG